MAKSHSNLTASGALRLTLLAGFGLALSGCAYGYGEAGYNTSSYNAYQCDPTNEFDHYYDCDNRYGFVNIGYGGGWYNNYYYPGYGFFLFDAHGGRHHMHDDYRRYWAQQRYSWYQNQRRHGFAHNGHNRRDNNGSRYDVIAWPERDGGRVREGHHGDGHSPNSYPGNRDHGNRNHDNRHHGHGYPGNGHPNGQNSQASASQEQNTAAQEAGTQQTAVQNGSQRRSRRDLFRRQQDGQSSGAVAPNAAVFNRRVQGATPPAARPGQTAQPVAAPQQAAQPVAASAPQSRAASAPRAAPQPAARPPVARPAQSASRPQSGYGPVPED